MKKTALITGATAGIGEATARLFAANNWQLIITGRRAKRLQSLQKILETEFGVAVLPLVFDVSKSEAVESAVNSIPETFKPIDVLVNNAGLAVGKDLFHEAHISDWERMIDTNVKGLLYMSRLVAPSMVERQQGHIINIGSIAGIEAYKQGNVYCATKFAVDALCQAMRIDMLAHGIKVTSINPGLVETEFSVVRYKGDKQQADNVYTNLTPLSAQDIADTIWYAASRPAHVNINKIVITPRAQANAHNIVRKGW